MSKKKKVTPRVAKTAVKMQVKVHPYKEDNEKSESVHRKDARAGK